MDFKVNVQYRLDKDITLPHVPNEDKDDWGKNNKGQLVQPDKAFYIKELDYA